ncbi:hypothetical protein [Pseudomonas syringae]|nr:hypothetical protein [Pseudomonas syringae]
MKYFEWEGAVTEAVADALQVGRFDASGIVAQVHHKPSHQTLG